MHGLQSYLRIRLDTPVQVDCHAVRVILRYVLAVSMMVVGLLHLRDIVSLTLDADTFRDADGRRIAATVGGRVGSAITLGAFAVLGAALVQSPRPRINPKHCPTV